MARETAVHALVSILGSTAVIWSFTPVHLGFSQTDGPFSLPKDKSSVLACQLINLPAWQTRSESTLGVRREEKVLWAWDLGHFLHAGSHHLRVSRLLSPERVEGKLVLAAPRAQLETAG